MSTGSMILLVVLEYSSAAKNSTSSLDVTED